jgi:hypothetical protein
MADLAESGYIIERALYMMIAEFLPAFRFIGHVAIGTGNSPFGMNTQRKKFKIRMLRFQDRGSA